MADRDAELMSYAQMLHKEAHDSGDSLTVFHCPSCGSGQVLGRSDNTIECQFCGLCFSVQVQPRFSAFPQTVNGVPMQVPGMPGTGQQAPGQLAPPPGEDQMPPPDDEGPEQDADDGQEPGGAANPFTSAADLRRLAVAFGDDPKRSPNL